MAFADDSEMYTPTGLCSQGCCHAATEIYHIYRGSSRFDFRCGCCAARARLDRALNYIAKLPELEAEFHAAEVKCGKS